MIGALTSPDRETTNQYRKLVERVAYHSSESIGCGAETAAARDQAAGAGAAGRVVAACGWQALRFRFQETQSYALLI